MTKSTPKAPTTSRQATPVMEGDDSRSRTKAKAALSPAMNAAIATESYQRNLLGDDMELIDLVDVLRLQTKRVQDGDLSGLEAMLVGQATALQTIFTSLVRRAQVQTHQRNLEAFLALGLKAQAQSRATIQALVELKFPRQVAFVKQTNVAHGPQQVNNHVGIAHAKENQTQQTKLLEDGTNGGTYLDTGTTAAASGGDPTLEAVGEVNRPAKRRGKAAC
jgi:hypothetical protein